MKKALAFLILLLGLPLLLSAQWKDSWDDIWENDPNDPSMEEPSTDDPIFVEDWDIYEPDVYQSGDKTFMISLGVAVPLAFLDHEGDIMTMNINPRIGGTGCLAYSYFITRSFFIGGEVSGMFFPTLGGNTLYVIPLGLRTGYQFVFGKFELPLTLTVGMTWQTYLDKRYYGFFLKGGAAIYYRFNHEWSFGLNTNLYWLPQRSVEEGPENKKVRVPEKNVDGLFLDITLSVRYHF